MDRITLFCLPFAGGSKYSFREYETRMPRHVEMICLEYPGRGNRSDEPLMSDVGELVHDLFLQVTGKLDGPPYAFYGHSMGALLVFLLARKIVAADKKPPLHIFITGCEGPSAPSRTQERRHLLDKAAFIQELKDLDGCPDEILNDAELLDHFEPILRSDFKAGETYVYEEADPLNIPITVITGTDEKMESGEIQLWQKESRLKVDFRCMPGNHFFIFDHPDAIIKVIVEKLFSHPKFISHESVRKIS